ncbi:unnamed protein product [Paramecium sonneborni]|uniref:PSI domain-containing protein n=1 Tax=Paramecium sonneborni TaxID=65129 RepID=A0A8S1RB78_9CILI|nr:unnamed protein product [Paramecium sonneborni]
MYLERKMLQKRMSTSSHADCQTYDSSCTLNNTGSGCVPIPLKCEAITIEAACNLRLQITSGVRSYQPCGWTGSQCIDKACSTAPKTISTTSDCQSYISTCVANNPVTVSGTSTIQGCQDLPTTCALRRSSENCEITRSGFVTCLWNTATSTCVEKSCATANVTTTPGYLLTFAFSDCIGYLNTCISNNTGDGCIAKPASCSSLVSSNCRVASKASGDCYWTGSSCVDRTCANIPLTTHSACQGALSSCTTNNGKTACQTLAAACTSYGSSENCKVTSTNKNCIWTGSACRNATCSDASDTNAYDSDSECSAYPTPSETCTVLYKTGKLGCVARSANCSDYVSSDQCYRTLTSASDDCTWNSTVNKCFSNTYLQGACSTFKGTQAQCESFKLGCTNTGSAVETDSCTFSCAKVTGLSGANHSTCQGYSTTCTVNVAGDACVTQAAACSTYAQTDCTTKIGGLKCFWDGSTCLDITSSNCDAVTGATGLNHAGCQAFNTACTNKAATDCQLFQTTCSSYTAGGAGACVNVQSGLKCFWDGTDCLAITSVKCDAVTGLTGLDHAGCQAFNTACTNKAATDCQLFQTTCSSYTAGGAGACVNVQSGLKCFWDGTDCLAITSANCDAVTGATGLNHAECQAFNTACTNKAATDCQLFQTTCSSYTAGGADACVNVQSGLKCFWDGSACLAITSANCNAVTGLTGLDHAGCQAYSTACTNKAATDCQLLQTACSSYTAGGSTACVNVQSGLKCFWNGSACLDITSANCSAVTGLSNLTYENCQAYSTACSVRRDKTGCVTQQSQCSGYSSAMVGCYKSTAGLCIATTSSDTACAAASSATTCEAVFLGTGNYSDANCNAFKTGCIALSTTGCQTKTCANYSGGYNHGNCNSWVNTCTVNSSNTGCTTMPATCAVQTSSNCIYSVEGACVVVGTACVKKTCDTATADSSYDSNGECTTYLATCTVARTGGCQARAACSSYKSNQQCKFNTSAGKCFWNPTNKNCVDLNCGNIEATSSYDTHTECVGVDATLACTVRATAGAAVAGCMARGSCGSYTIEEQCQTNASGGVCVWNTNATQAVCQDKSCTTAPTSTATHNDCYTYYNTATMKCTVVATPDTNGGSPVLGGCQQTAACSTYIHQEQCQINATGDPCGWNGTQCADKSCATAPATADYDDNTKCRAYFNNKCTVAEAGQGCVEIPATCEVMTEKQCVSDKSGRSCYWTGTACITRTCENAPDATATADECNTYLAGCTLDSVKCKTKVCEDFAFATDALCKQALTTCTTNGINCVTRGTCFQAQNEAGCVTSSTNLQCEWMPAVGANQAYCTIKTCNTAPVTLTTEAACASYFTNCTTKNGGGCVTKSTCSAVTIDVACTTALNGTVCAWDAAQNKCRDKDCQDFSGTTHAACQVQKAGCTAGANGKCARVQNCEQTTIRSACIEGTNGPCLWINDYTNSDGSKGACFRYTSCKSLNWNSDSQCKWISNQCTTNGSNCVGITLCSETNTDGGCVTGYDGACIQSVPALNSSDPKVCKPYTSCADAFYTTHADCQVASRKCTTNGTTGCIALGACSSYTSQAGCFFNDKGAILTSGAITSTGICTWDTTSSSCRDQTCADLTGTTHATCSSQLSTCTSDGTTCLVKGTCASYSTQTACTTAVGSDGICYWELASATNNNTAKCRLMTCADVQNGTSTNVCLVALSSCVSNGTACISKANCSTYTTKTACNSGGLDGICVFTQSTATGAAVGTGTCALMTACVTANNDQTACQAARDRCSWTAASGTGATAVASKCSSHTCATNQATNGVCTRFLNWDKKTQQVCTLVSGACTATDPATLSLNDCFLVSGYTYTWNASTSKCGVCTAVVVQPNNTSNNNTSTTDNTTTTDSGYLLGLSTIFLGYLMF